MREVERGHPGPQAEDTSQPVTYLRDTLAAAGLDRMTAHRWQTISHIPEARLEQWFAGIRDGAGFITLTAAYTVVPHRALPVPFQEAPLHYAAPRERTT